ncbi:hypothetical protein Ahy_B10g101084 [Arachis hypogaea]|uniref:Uncharacterized protein n=1 Tax=Arachis hypogaea TaxID=3818 RepID=A0A444WYM4_ARAHY|nr:hypothetical protein Ahy_B10g101084 [Arachis hypogaea]
MPRQDPVGEDTVPEAQDLALSFGDLTVREHGSVTGDGSSGSVTAGSDFLPHEPDIVPKFDPKAFVIMEDMEQLLLRVCARLQVSPPVFFLRDAFHSEGKKYHGFGVSLQSTAKGINFFVSGRLSTDERLARKDAAFITLERLLEESQVNIFDFNFQVVLRYKEEVAEAHRVARLSVTELRGSSFHEFASVRFLFSERKKERNRGSEEEKGGKERETSSLLPPSREREHVASQRRRQGEEEPLCSADDQPPSNFEERKTVREDEREGKLILSLPPHPVTVNVTRARRRHWRESSPLLLLKPLSSLVTQSCLCFWSSLCAEVAAAVMGGRGGYVNTTANCSLALPLLIRFKAIAAAAVAEDDAFLVKQIGQSFRLNIDRIHFLIKARREEQIQAAHDEAMFGALALPPLTSTDSEPERENEKEVDKKAVVTSLLSETVSGFTADLCG